MSRFRPLIVQKIDAQAAYVLEQLAILGPVTADRIAPDEILSYDAVNRRLKTLRVRGLVKMTHPNGNGKVYLYELSPSGVELAQQLIAKAS
jgi:DNA-binding MarR family transcriptional regulator